MNNDLRELESLKWLDRAKSDLRVAKMAIADEEPEFGLTCYLSQQCAEKSLKSLLIKLNIRFNYKHNLDYLAGSLPPNYEEIFNQLDLEWLSDWITEGRYPGDYPEATWADANKALQMAELIYLEVCSVKI